MRIDDHLNYRRLPVPADLLRIVGFDHDHAPGAVYLGTQGLEREDTYDHRGRLTHRVCRATDAATGTTRVVVDLRYDYDDADRERIRQDLPRDAGAHPSTTTLSVSDQRRRERCANGGRAMLVVSWAGGPDGPGQVTLPRASA